MAVHGLFQRHNLLSFPDDETEYIGAKILGMAEMRPDPSWLLSRHWIGVKRTARRKPQLDCYVTPKDGKSLVGGEGLILSCESLFAICQ